MSRRRATGIAPPSTRESATGISELDRLAAVVLDNDLEARRELLRFTTAGCTTADGLGGPPKCDPGQAEGTPVDFLPIMGPGEGLALLPGEVDESLDFFDRRAVCGISSGRYANTGSELRAWRLWPLLFDR